MSSSSSVTLLSSDRGVENPEEVTGGASKRLVLTANRLSLDTSDFEL